MKSKPKLKKQISPYLLIVLSFLTLVILGSLLLVLPISSVSGSRLSFIDALFIATSAVTITGLTPIVTLSTTLTLFGKISLALLIQLGGLGIITLSVFVMILIGAKIGISNRVLIKENLNSPSMAGVVKLIRKIVIITFLIELIGFFVNLIVFSQHFPFVEAMGYSAFHAISSFNNAGFDLLPGTGLIGFNGNVLLMINTGLLVALGGLGFIVISDIIKKRSFRKLMTHSKVVLIVNLILWVGGALLIKLGQVGFDNITWLDSFVLSISARTAGLPIVNMSILTSFNVLVLSILMFIGGSPSSTAGGIKTTTVYTITKTVYSFATGKEALVGNRRISEASKRKSFVLLTVALTTVLIGTLLLLLFEEMTVGQALLEVISAGSNTGYSMNLTPLIGVPSKLILILIMFIGRVGPITVITLLNKNWYKTGTPPITYLEEKTIIG